MSPPVHYADEPAWLQSLQSLRDEMQQQHGRQTERFETLRNDVNRGFSDIRSEMKVQNGRVGATERQVAVLEAGIVPIQRFVYGIVALLCTSVILGVLSLVLRR